MNQKALTKALFGLRSHTQRHTAVESVRRKDYSTFMPRGWTGFVKTKEYWSDAGEKNFLSYNF